MASPMASTGPSYAPSVVGVILDVPADWDEWIAMIKANALDMDVWAHMDSTQKNEPALPIKPKEPTPIEVRANSTLLTLTGEDLSKYRILRDEYKTNLAEYKEKDHAITEVKKLIRKTVSRRNLIHLEDKSTAYQMLQALQTRLAPTDRARKIDLTRQYNELKRTPKTQSIDVWLQRWEKIYVDAVRINLPDVQDERPLYDFLSAIKGLDSTFAAVQENSFEEKLYSGAPLPSLYDLLERYRNHVRIQRATAKTPSHNAFGTLHKESPEDSSKSSGNGNPSFTGQRACLCGEMHQFKDCLYLMEHLRKSDWSPKPEIDKTVKSKLKRSERLRSTVERIRKSSQDASSKPQGSKTAQTKSTEEQTTADSSAAVFAIGRTSYKLENCWILDSGADIHICNDPNRFIFDRTATEENILFSGKTTYQIEAYGTVMITVQAPTGPIPVKLINVALVPGFFTNLVALRRLTEKGVHWDTENGRLHRNGSTFCYTRNFDDHWVLEYNELTLKEGSAFATSRDPRPSKEETALRWHSVLGHSGPEALSQLEQAVHGAKVTGEGPTTTECETCGLSKAHKLISRRTNKEDPAEAPMARVAYDLIQMTPAYNGDKWISHFSDYFTSMDFIYTHTKKSQSVEIIKEFVAMIKTRYSRSINSIRYLRTDGETSLGRKFDVLIANLGITTERSAPYTPSQNGAAERSGGVIVTKARCLRIAASLPANMWPEIAKTAGYLNNRTPKRQLQWKTPFEALTQQKPDLSHLRVYGCRAYPLKYNIPRTQKLEPRAHIGYLIGYDSTNIYQIWIPSRERVVRVRDVTFNESTFYDPKELDLGHILREEIEQTVEILDYPSISPWKGITEQDSDVEDEIKEDSDGDVETENTLSQQSDTAMRQNPTPDPTPEPSTSLINSQQRLTADFNPANILAEGSKRERRAPRRDAYAVQTATNLELASFHSAFATATETPVRSSIHRDSLPAEP